ncbi:tRNA (guanine(26)-N(2))-dimethyltransferase [Cynara cardunculus var. scolymus]|uniref:tRNA (guanine(26)-N(2))-dimethyltransferase n=1 Tax=Cynara cardunculus var. scolymus TaxID=59895 RepID=UPI000D62F60B|nr:tRNA (guanine(26)-N(2))-dimethyltransferase [Cynara cardunculus var. scolymus]
MISVCPTTLSPFHLTSPPQNPSHRPSNLRPLTALVSDSHYETERGFEFETGDTFFRHESATGRDLGVLAAALYKRSNDKLRVLDAMCGCGIRSLRYLAEARADFVLANDANEDCNGVIVSNLSTVSSEDEGRWKVSHSVANRVLAERYVERDYFDFIDVDSFGSDSSFFRSAFDTVKLGGLLYVTSTDGFSSGGHRPNHSLAAYGAYIRPHPYSNEIGLRMLIGGAVREASVLGYHVSPLFSYYSYHGPVFRVLLRVNRGKLPHGHVLLVTVCLHYRFISYCDSCGNSQAVSWDELGQMNCSCGSDVPDSLVVSGPLWTGPLHCAAYLTEMLGLAGEWGWLGSGTKNDLDKLLQRMIDESDPNLSFGYIKLDEIASRAKVNSPPLVTILNAIHQEGYSVSRSHISSNAIKTNCPMSECIRIAKQLRQC